MDKRIGQYAFIGSILLALVLGIITPMAVINQQVSEWLISILVVLGVLVGFFNVPEKQKKEYFVAATVLIIAAGIGQSANFLGGIVYAGEYLRAIFQALLAVVIPAVTVATLKELWNMSMAK